MTYSKQPSPGSDEAVKEGCTCPVLDNHHGAGIVGNRNVPMYWIRQDCPLHAKQEEADDDTTST